MGSWMDLIDLYHDPALITSMDFIILKPNRWLVKLLGLPSEKLVGQNLRAFEGDRVDLAEQEIQRKEIAKEGHYHGFSLLRSASGKEYLAERNINRVRMGEDDKLYLIHQYAIEKKISLADYKDLIKLKNEIHTNMRNLSDVRVLEEKFNIGYRRILYLFKVFEGKPPKQYLNDVKLSRCKKMIREGKYSFKEIAFELGFCDTSHLSNVFKGRTDKTLKEYQKEIHVECS